MYDMDDKYRFIVYSEVVKIVHFLSVATNCVYLHESIMWNALLPLVIVPFLGTVSEHFQ